MQHIAVRNDPDAPGSAPPPEEVDSGLSALSLIAGYYRIAADPSQLRHQLALTGRQAGSEDLVRAANV
ncbi:peptidase C39-like protein, partial [Roseiarcus fermentans]